MTPAAAWQPAPDERTAIEDAVAAALRIGAPDPQTLEEDPVSFLRLLAVADVAAEEAARLRGEAVVAARHAGHSWEAVGRVLGVSRQAAHQRFGGLIGEDATGQELKVVTGATAFNEVAILDREGRSGYHLVDFGVLRLVFAPSDQPWEHLRLAFASAATRRSLQDDGWELVGTWFPFSYLKRPAGGTV